MKTTVTIKKPADVWQAWFSSSWFVQAQRTPTSPWFVTGTIAPSQNKQDEQKAIDAYDRAMGVVGK